jgi:hypothetical protein
MGTEGVEIALPEGFEDHPVGRLRPFKKTGNVKIGVRSEDRPHTGPCCRDECHVAIVDRRWLRRWRLRDWGRGARIRIRRLEDGLLFVASALTEHAVKSKPDEQGNQCKDDDNGQILIL